MFQSLRHDVTESDGLAVNYTKDYDLTTAYGCSVQAVYTDVTPVAKTFVAADVTVNPTNTITITTHGFFTGLKVALTGTNLPTGLSATNYWVIVVNANTISLASSLANAVLGTAVHITGAGTTADATLTPAALGSVVIKLQMSNDGTNFTDISGKTVTVSATGSVLWDLGTTTYRTLRVNEAASAGAINLVLNFNSTNSF
jgi:hypothetical protein